MLKSIKRISSNRFEQSGPGFRTINIFNGEYQIEPYLAFTDYYMNQPIFGPHPHAGVSVMTYMHPDSAGSFRNRDSFGDHSIIKPGGVHVTQAGIGIMHDEVPEHTGTDCHGFQIWINHSNKDRLVPPTAFHAHPDEIPEVKVAGSTVRVIQGSYEGKKALFEMVTPVSLFDVYLERAEKVTLPADEMAFIYVVSGKGKIDNQTFQAHDVIVFGSEGEEVKVEAVEDHQINFMFASGTPHNEPIAYGGPYVMTNEQQLDEAKRRFAQGEMGQLSPL